MFEEIETLEEEIREFIDERIGELLVSGKLSEDEEDEFREKLFSNLRG